MRFSRPTSVLLSYTLLSGFTESAKWEASCDALAEFLRFIPRPTVDHVKIVFDVIESQSDWDVLIEATELLTNKYEDDDNIRDWERYALSAFRQNLEN